MSKPEVRQAAEQMGLAIADKADSQDICFVPQGRYSDVIAKLRPDAAEPGENRSPRRSRSRPPTRASCTIRSDSAAASVSLPATRSYVVHLDAARARVVVGPREALATRRVYLRNMNWLGDGTLDDIPAEGMDLFAKVRSTRPPRPARLHADHRGVWVELADGEAGVAPGQACALYTDEGNEARVLGGGFIERSERGVEAEAMLARLSAMPAA